MRVVMSGSSGLVGSALCQKLAADGHHISRLVRPGTQPRSGDVSWDPGAAVIDMSALEGAEAIIHLSGASIAEHRWTEARKAELRSSRIDTTRVLVDAILRLRQKPRVFICASAVGYYGDCGDDILTETYPYGTDFLGLLARDWEAEAARASHGGIRTVSARLGVILTPEGGALPKLLAPIRRGVGGRLGKGRQWMPWVTLEDVIEVMRNALTDARYEGAINVVSPNPVRNAEFVRIAANLLHRPAVLPAPAFALGLVLGEMAQPLLLASQRVRPARLMELGYTFRDKDLEPTLQGMIAQMNQAQVN
jgi:uncharacterized protein (TIGR01777 family)